MKIRTMFLVALAAASLAACQKDKKAKRPNANMPISMEKAAKGDRGVYGLACMGCTDTAVVLLPNSGGDPVRYNILDANRHHQVFGDIEIGDRLCVIPCTDKDDRNGADVVIDLDDLQATWTYPVMPHLRDVSHLSKRQQARILANMPDSIVETYMIPREYGFTLSRMNEARSVGHVMQASAVEDDSPVEYPEVPQYNEWRTYNGKLILTRGHMQMGGATTNTNAKAKASHDTLSLVFLHGDSLALRDSRGNVQGFHRKSDALSANAAAQAAAAKQANKLKQVLK